MWKHIKDIFKKTFLHIRLRKLYDKNLFSYEEEDLPKEKGGLKITKKKLSPIESIFHSRVTQNALRNRKNKIKIIAKVDGRIVYFTENTATTGIRGLIADEIWIDKTFYLENKKLIDPGLVFTNKNKIYIS